MPQIHRHSSPHAGLSVLRHRRQRQTNHRTTDRHAAAIASANAAEYYGAQILAANIEDNPENFTRFYLIHRAADAITPEDANKVSLAFALENRPGSLVNALSSIADLGANLTKIESRPVPGKPWEYIFYVDAQ